MADPWLRREVVGDCTLYLGDCTVVIPSLTGAFGAVVTDPPYGIGINKSGRLSTSRGFGGETWDDEPADLSWLLPLRLPAIVWGGNYFGLPAHRAPLVWDKDNAGRDFADFELAWTNLDMVARRFVMRPMNMDGGKVHPTQKPVALMRWCLAFLPAGSTVLDPFMGSGSTLVAAVREGRAAIGIERSERHFNTAVRRVREAYAQPDFLVAPPAPQPVQQGLDL